MDIPIESKDCITLACRHCLKASRTVTKGELHCSLRMDFFAEDHPACKKIAVNHVVLDRERKLASVETKPVEKKPTVPEPKVIVKEVPGMYVWIGTDPMVVGKIIGREGRNIQTLTRLTNTTINIDGGMAWIGGDDREGERMAAAILHAVYKMPQEHYHPGVIEACVMVCRARLAAYRRDMCAKAASLLFWLKLERGADKLDATVGEMKTKEVEVEVKDAK